MRMRTELQLACRLVVLRRGRVASRLAVAVSRRRGRDDRRQRAPCSRAHGPQTPICEVALESIALTMHCSPFGHVPDVGSQSCAHVRFGKKPAMQESPFAQFVVSHDWPAIAVPGVTQATCPLARLTTWQVRPEEPHVASSRSVHGAPASDGGRLTHTGTLTAPLTVVSMSQKLFACAHVSMQQ